MTQILGKDSQLTRVEADKIYDTVDSDKSGQISYEEFLEAVKKVAWQEKLIALNLENLQLTKIREVLRTKNKLMAIEDNLGLGDVPTAPLSSQDDRVYSRRINQVLDEIIALQEALQEAPQEALQEALQKALQEALQEELQKAP